MGCAIIHLDGGHGHICGPGVKPCIQCGTMAEYLCDYPMGRGKTCDAQLCERHAIVQGRVIERQPRLFDDGQLDEEPEQIHFCPAHAAIALAAAR